MSSSLSNSYCDLPNMYAKSNTNMNKNNNFTHRRMTGQQQQQQQESKPRQLPILISGNSISTSNLHLPPHQSTKNSNSNHPDSDKTNIEELYKIIEIQQKTINKLTAELTHKSQGIPRGSYQKALNSLE